MHKPVCCPWLAFSPPGQSTMIRHCEGAAVRGSVHQSPRETLRLHKWKHRKLKIPKQVPHGWEKTISSRFQQPYLEFVTFESPRNATLLTERSTARSGAAPNTNQSPPERWRSKAGKRDAQRGLSLPRSPRAQRTAFPQVSIHTYNKRPCGKQNKDAATTSRGNFICWPSTSVLYG